MSFLSQSVRMQRGSSDILPRRFSRFRFRLVRRHTVDPRTYRLWDYIGGELHKEAFLIGLELVVGPEGIVKGKISMLAVIRIIGVIKSSHVAYHVHT